VNEPRPVRCVDKGQDADMAEHAEERNADLLQMIKPPMRTTFNAKHNAQNRRRSSNAEQDKRSVTLQTAPITSRHV
jgi:hypothetical protein